MIYILPLIFTTIFIILFTGLKVTPQDNAVIIERHGTYHRTIINNAYLLVPFIDKAVKIINLREQEINLSHTANTSDSVAKKVNAEVYYQIVNPEIYAYHDTDSLKLLKRMIRNQITENINMYKINMLADKDVAISERMIATLNVDTMQWGAKITRIYITIY